jgi:DNA sulfur modification protein DndE
MKPPVEHVRVSAKGKEILIKIKRHTGLEHWNEISRIALFHSLTSLTPPPAVKCTDSSIDMDWKVFSGQWSDEISALIWVRAKNDGVDLSKKDAISDYFRAHLERGIIKLNTCKSLFDLSYHG